MPSTLVHALLPAACIASRRASLAGLSRTKVMTLLIVCAAIANFPDLDVLGVIFFPKCSDLIHRNIGHNALALGVWIILGRWVISAIDPVRFSPLRSYLYSFTLVVSHIFLDAGCLHEKGGIAGVPLFWPFSEWELESPIPFFSDYQLHQGHDWVLGHAFAIDFWQRAFFQEILVSALFFVFFLVLDRGTHKLLSARRRRVKISHPAEAPEQFIVKAVQ